jgi:UDP-N-acetylmuramate dehydrogenase
MVSENISLLPFNTFGIDVKAARFARFKSIEELSTLLTYNPKQNLLILGGGSNLLLTKDFDGLVLKNEIEGINLVSENEDSVIIEAGAGVVWHQFVLHCIENNWGGVENLSLIPGSVGASPMQNIGAYGVEIKDVFHSLEAFEIKTGTTCTFDATSCKFGYRESVFKNIYKNQYIISKVSFKLTKKHTLNTSYGSIEEELQKANITHPTIKDVSNAVIAIRQSKLPDPKVLGNAGSFFKNPVISNALYETLKLEFPTIPGYTVSEAETKVPAGWLIEQSGWKGKSFETHGVHSKQALVLVNLGKATGSEIYSLSEKIISDIKERFQITLEREVNIL